MLKDYYYVNLWRKSKEIGDVNNVKAEGVDAYKLLDNQNNLNELNK